MSYPKIIYLHKQEPHFPLRPMTIKRDGEIIHQLIPCQRKSDLVYGVYDTVTKKFFTNKAKETAMKDVYNPDYYKTGKIEVSDFIEDKEFNFFLGNVVKYVSRAGKKDGNSAIQDLKKAQWYLNKEISRLETKDLTVTLDNVEDNVVETATISNVSETEESKWFGENDPRAPLEGPKKHPWHSPYNYSEEDFGWTEDDDYDEDAEYDGPVEAIFAPGKVIHPNGSETERPKFRNAKNTRYRKK